MGCAQVVSDVNRTSLGLFCVHRHMGDRNRSLLQHSKTEKIAGQVSKPHDVSEVVAKLNGLTNLRYEKI